MKYIVHLGEKGISPFARCSESVSAARYACGHEPMAIEFWKAMLIFPEILTILKGP